MLFCLKKFIFAATFLFRLASNRCITNKMKKEMNRLIVFLFAALMLAMPLSAKRSHYAKVRNHPIDMMDKDTAGVIAYSDTTSLAQADALDADSIYDDDAYSQNSHFELGDNDLNALMKIFSGLFGVGVLGVIVAILIAIVSIVSIIAPFVFFGFLVYLIINHHNEKQRLARMALMSGQPIPQNIMKKKTETADEQWQRGLKNVFIGLGIAVLCYCLGAYQLAGIGWLVLIYGAGLAVISKTSNKKKEDNDPKNGENIG